MTIREVLEKIKLIDDTVDIELFDKHGLFFNFLVYENKYLIDDAGVEYDLDMEIEDYDLEYSPTHYKERVLYLYYEDKEPKNKVTNRERIMAELSELSDRDFAVVLQDTIALTCEDCPRSLCRLCSGDDTACFMEMAYWLQREYVDENKLIHTMY